MSEFLESHWTIDEVLASLPGTTRIDDECDLLAFRVAGCHPTRTAYVYLYGGDARSISFDLEDAAVENGQWDHAVRHGTTSSLDELRRQILPWLSDTGT